MNAHAIILEKQIQRARNLGFELSGNEGDEQGLQASVSDLMMGVLQSVKREN